MGGLNGDLGVIYKVYFKLTPGETEEENKEEFGAIPLNIRNHSTKNGYRYYNENGETISIKNEFLNRAFIENNLVSEKPSLSSYIITEDKDMYELVTGIIPPKDEEEEEGLKNFRLQMKQLVEDALVDLLRRVKYITEKAGANIEESEFVKPEEVEVKCGCSDKGCSHAKDNS